MLTPITSKRFKKDIDKAKKQKRDLDHLKSVMDTLIKQEPLKAQYLDHPLKNWKGHRDCHIENDFVLIYRIDNSLKKIYFERIGSHSEVF